MDITIIEKIPLLIPKLLELFIPGYIFLILYDFILCRNKREKDDLFIKSIVISFIIISICKIFFSWLGPNYFTVTSIIMSSLGALIVSKIITTNWFNSLLKLFGINQSTYSNIFHQIIDLKYGVYATVYLKDEEYIIRGFVRKYEILGDDNIYMMLDEYEICDYHYKTIQVESDSQSRVLIKVSNSDMIEFYYNKHSSVLQNNHRGHKDK